MKRLSIRWLVLGVGVAALGLPLVTLLGLRAFDRELVAQTEQQLHSEGALIAENYRQLWGSTSGKTLGNPKPPGATATFVRPPVLHSPLAELLPALPQNFPQNADFIPNNALTTQLSAWLRAAQIFNLSGTRVLDPNGCVIASSRGQLGECLTELPELARALHGQYTSVLRARQSDEPAPRVGSIRRRGEIRVFIARPVWNDGELIGAVWLSRTAESSLEFLFKYRRDVFFGGLFVMGFLILLTAVCAQLLVRPLRRMAARATGLARGEPQAPLADLSGFTEMQALGQAFDQLTAQLAERARYISEYVANVSHELKTPLTSIRGAVELLRDAGDSMARDQHERFLSNMDAAAARTERLVERLLLLARLENPAVERSHPSDRVRVGTWLADFQNTLSEPLAVEISPHAARAERSAFDLETVLRNLVDNAARFRQQKPISVQINLKGSQLEIRVTDDGPGISPENQSRVFDRFFTTHRDRGGTGLGLSIVKALTESRSGSISLVSSPQGTTAIAVL